MLTSFAIVVVYDVCDEICVVCGQRCCLVHRGWQRMKVDVEVKMKMKVKMKVEMKDESESGREDESESA